MHRIKNPKQELLAQREKLRLRQEPTAEKRPIGRVALAQVRADQARSIGLSGLFRDGFDASPRGGGDLFNAMRRMPDWIGPAQPRTQRPIDPPESLVEVAKEITPAGLAAGIQRVDSASNDGLLSGAAAGVRPVDTASTDDIIGYSSKS